MNHQGMTQKTACVDLQFHLETVNLQYKKGLVNYLIEEMTLFK